MFCFFGFEVHGTLTPQPGIEPTPPALKRDVLATGPPGKSLNMYFFISVFFFLHKSNLFIVEKGDKMMIKQHNINS